MKLYRCTIENSERHVICEPIDGSDAYPLPPRLDLLRISPLGFAWGFVGNGPAQLALAMLADATKNDEAALGWYQLFKAEVIVSMDQDLGWEITSEAVREWLQEQLGAHHE